MQRNVRRWIFPVVILVIAAAGGALIAMALSGGPTGGTDSSSAVERAMGGASPTTFTPVPIMFVTPTVAATRPTPTVTAGGSAAPRVFSPTAAATRAVAAPATPAPPTRAAESPTAVATSLPLKIVKQGFGQQGQQLGFAFIVQNPYADATIDQSHYVVDFYDRSDTVAASASGSIAPLAPGQALGVADRVALPRAATITRLEVRLKTGPVTSSAPVPTVDTSAVAWTAGPPSARVAGTIENRTPNDLRQVRAAAVGYDAAGKIDGGGSLIVDFVPANGQTTVKVPVTSSAPPASVELYASLSALPPPQ